MANKMLPSGISVRIREDLIDGVSRVQTTLTIDPIVTLDGHRVTMADIGSIGYAKLDGGTSREEIMSWTGITDNTTTYTLTGCVWGVNFYNLSNATANYKRHTAGAKFEIKTDMHYLTNQFRDNEDNVFTSTAAMEFQGNEIKLGDGTAVTDKKLTADNGDANSPFVKYNETTNKWEISNDGVNSYDPEQGGSGLVAGEGISIVSGEINVKTAETSGLHITADEVTIEYQTDPGLSIVDSKLGVKVKADTGLLKDSDGIYCDSISPDSPPVDPTDNAGKIVRCDTDGQVPVPEIPVSDDSATSKWYVDDIIINLPDQLSGYLITDPLKLTQTSFGPYSEAFTVNGDVYRWNGDDGSGGRGGSTYGGNEIRTAEKDTIINFRVKLISGQAITVGVADYTAGTQIVNSSVNKGYWIYSTGGGSTYACKGTGSANVNQALTATETDWNTYRIVANASSIKYYVNGTLAHTITTALPTGAVGFYVAISKSNESGYSELDLASFYMYNKA